LFTDSDCDMTPELCAKYGYKLISMPYSVDGKLIRPYEDFETFDSHAYYEMLRGGVLPTTSAVSTETYIQYFEPEFKAGKDILYVHFSAAMTNSFEFMAQAKEILKEKYPERTLYEIDTMGITIVSRAIAEDVGEMFRAGKSVEEILAWAKPAVEKRATYFTVDNLKFFHRSGRVSGLSATMGTLLGIRPIISMNAEGKMAATGQKEKGRKNALRRIVEIMKEIGEDVTQHRIIVGHSDNQEMADEVTAMIKEAFGECEIEYSIVNPTAGAHCGPDGLGVTFNAVRR
ncbi:MAG: DegV family protein, partial [Lachnospiraceae bacterium]|nr:DegV family protein [Lachnospiraceae bacterium]